jgi:hypothetical protein
MRVVKPVQSPETLKGREVEHRKVMAQPRRRNASDDWSDEERGREETKKALQHGIYVAVSGR